MDRMPSLETTEELLAHSAWLTRVARALTTNADDAEEVVQQTWLQALERPPVHRRNLRAWLATLARNLVRSRQRAQATRIAHAPSLPRPEPSGSPAESVARAELQQVVLDAVLALAEPYRSTLVQRFLDELSAEEIAKRRGEPVETVRTRVKRGLDQVRVRVAERLGGEREQLPALLAPLLSGGGAVVATSAKAGWLVGIAAAVVVVSATVVATRGRHEGGARDAAQSVAPAEAEAAAKPEPAFAAARETEAASKPPAEAAASPVPPTFDVVGTVVDANGAAVAGASVLLFDREGNDGRSWVTLLSMFERSGRTGRSSSSDSTRIETTDVRGSFQISSVERAQRRRIVAFDPTGGLSAAIDVEPPVDSGPRQVSLRLLGGIAVHGHVVDADGGWVDHAKLSVEASNCFVTGSNEYFTDDRSFSIPPLPVEELTLSAIDQKGTHRSQPLKLRASDGPAVREVTLHLDREPFAVTLHGRVLGPDQQPLVASHPFLKGLAEAQGRGREALRVHVWPVFGAIPKVGAPYTSAAAGLMSFDAKRGEYTATALLDDELRPTCLVAEAGMWVIAVMPLDEALLEPTDDVHEVPDLVVADLVKPPETATAALDVTVVDAAGGQPLEGETTHISILVRLDGGASSLLGNQGSSHRQQVIPPSRASIVASCRGYVADGVDGDFPARAEPYVLKLALQRGVRAVRGVVLDGERHPVAGARVCWLCEAGGVFRGTALEPATTEASGRFEFVAVGSGRGRVAVEAEHLVPAFADVEAGDKDVTADVELASGVTVTFTLAPNPDGRELPGVLRITRSDDSIVRDDWDLRHARFTRKWPRTLTLAPGPYRFHVDFMSRADADGDFTASEAAEVVVAPRVR
jgi:RNA polymerase sigma-70 factor (ECF subfamily)